MTGRHLKVVESEAGTSASFVNFSKHRREHTNKQTNEQKKKNFFFTPSFLLSTGFTRLQNIPCSFSSSERPLSSLTAGMSNQIG